MPTHLDVLLELLVEGVARLELVGGHPLVAEHEWEVMSQGRQNIVTALVDFNNKFAAEVGWKAIP